MSETSWAIKLLPQEQGQYITFVEVGVKTRRQHEYMIYKYIESCKYQLKLYNRQTRINILQLISIPITSTCHRHQLDNTPVTAYKKGT